jgi:hypothetical protein
MTIIINSADKSTAILFLNNILSLLYEEGEVSLAEGNCVLLYSDGLVEAHDPKGRCSVSPGYVPSSPSMVRSEH